MSKADSPVKRPIRVLVAAPSLAIVGGQSRQAAELLDGLAGDAAVEADFVPHDPRLPGPLRSLQRVKYVRTIVTSVRYWTMLLGRVRRYDIVHAFSAAYWSYLLSAAPALLIARMFGRKAILNYHSGEAEDHLTRWRRIAPATMRLAHAIVVQSDFLVDVFARFGLRAVVVPNTVDIGRFRYRARTPPAPRFLTTRGLEPHYNVACVLRAFASIQRQRPDATLTIAGSGNQESSLRELAASLGIAAEFVGPVDYARIPQLYDDAGVYIMAPDVDNTPLSVIECYAAGLPVVTTSAGGIPRLVDDGVTGLLVPPGDAEALAAAALRVLDEPGLAERLARAGRDRADAFAWATVGPAWRDLYADLAGAARRAETVLAPGAAREPFPSTTGERQ